MFKWASEPTAHSPSRLSTPYQTRLKRSDQVGGVRGQVQLDYVTRVDEGLTPSRQFTMFLSVVFTQKYVVNKCKVRCSFHLNIPLRLTTSSSSLPSPDRMVEWVEHPSPDLRDPGIWTLRFETRLSETNDFKIYTCLFLARCSALIG